MARYSLTAGSNVTASSSFATATITPGAGRLVLAFVLSRRVGGAGLPTASGNGLTWHQVASITQRGPGQQPHHLLSRHGAGAERGPAHLRFRRPAAAGLRLVGVRVRQRRRQRHQRFRRRGCSSRRRAAAAPRSRRCWGHSRMPRRAWWWVVWCSAPTKRCRPARGSRRSICSRSGRAASAAPSRPRIAPAAARRSTGAGPLRRMPARSRSRSRPLP